MKLYIFAIMLAACWLGLVGGTATQADRSAMYDPARNPVDDLKQAVQTAQPANKRILLEVGGDWCSWCHILDKFIQQDQEVAEALQQNFVVVKINFSEENLNEKFLTNYPAIPGYPHFFILDSDGSLLHSQDTSELEQGETYNHDKFLAFLKKWGSKS